MLRGEDYERRLVGLMSNRDTGNILQYIQNIIKNQG